MLKTARQWCDLGEGGASERIKDAKTGPRTIWLGPEAARLLAALPWAETRNRVFPDDLTTAGTPGPHRVS